jgi:integrase
MAKKIRGRGEGSIYRRSYGAWRAQIYIKGRRLGKTFKKKTDALRWLRDTQHKLDRGYDFTRSLITLGEYLPRWLKHKRASLSASTVCQYEQVIQDHILPYFGKTQLKDLRLSRIERHYRELQAAKIGIRTIRFTHAVLHAALERAIKYGLLLQNPAHGATIPMETRSEMKVLNKEQVTQFLIAAQDSPHRMLYYLAINTGMRQGEIFGLKWSDVDWEKGILVVQRQVKRIPGQGWKFSAPKTKAGRRTIKLGEGLVQELRSHKDRQAFQKAVVGDRWQEHDLICPSSIGTPCNQSNLRKDMLRILKAAELPTIRFHDLRHTAASLMLNNGVPPIVVSKILGHSKPSVTLDIYGHLYSEMQTSAAEIMHELVSPIPLDLDEFQP